VPDSTDLGPDIPDFSGPFSNAHTQKIQSFLGNTPDMDFLEAFVLEFKLLLFHRVKFYADFTIPGDDAKWYAIRFAHDGIDYYLLIPKEDASTERHLLIYYDNSDLSEDVSVKTFDRLSQACFAVFEMARKDFQQRT
jgi:hypothetical protein